METSDEERIGKLLEAEESPDELIEGLAEAVSDFGLVATGRQWFDEQAGDPDLMRRRCLEPGEPLPAHLGLFTPDGRVPDRIPRRAVQALRDWLHDDEAVLAWSFPDGVPQEDEARYRREIARLRQIDWAPYQAIDAVLASWAEDEVERDVSLERARRDLMAVVEKVEQAAR